MPATATMIAERDPPPRLHDQYCQFFSMLRADSSDLIEEVYRLRYQVYCLENSFEDPADFPDGLERDGFDRRSKHALLLHRPTNAFAGTIRVILPEPGGARLPALQLLTDHGVHYADLIDEARTAELSRFAVSKTFRRRATDSRYPDIAAETAAERAGAQARIIPLMTLGLMTAALQIGIEHGMTHACAVVEPPLLRLLAKHGMVLHPIGPLVSHHGLRQPCYFAVAELLGILRERRPDLWQVVTDNGRLSP
jgi:N-acyl amino acid synthase of PEP-CTERM/exosortase system